MRMRICLALDKPHSLLTSARVRIGRRGLGHAESNARGYCNAVRRRGALNNLFTVRAMPVHSRLARQAHRVHVRIVRERECAQQRVRLSAPASRRGTAPPHRVHVRIVRQRECAQQRIQLSAPASRRGTAPGAPRACSDSAAARARTAARARGRRAPSTPPLPSFSQRAVLPLPVPAHCPGLQ